MYTVDRLTEAFEKGAKEVGEKLKGVAVHIEEKAPDIARGMAMITTASLVTAIPIMAFAVAFPTVSYVAPMLITLITFMVQLGIAVMVISLTVGVVRRII